MKVTQEGKNGKKRITSTAIYENGKQISQKVVSEAINSKPVTKFIIQGTKIIAQRTSSMISMSRGGDLKNHLSIKR